MPPWVREPWSLFGLILLVWFVYLSIKIAQHVDAWPFG